MPTLWIALGPLGQSITAQDFSGLTRRWLCPRRWRGMSVFAILYGVPVWGFAVLWIGLAAALTIHTIRRGMPSP